MTGHYLLLPYNSSHELFDWAIPFSYLYALTSLKLHVPAAEHQQRYSRATLESSSEEKKVIISLVVSRDESMNVIYCHST
jgi:hypothetical protein